jgi:hypothetical protein
LLDEVTDKPLAVSVEDITLEHYNTLDWSGFHCDGLALTTLFLLFFFTIIFSGFPGVFKNAYQTAPLDFGSDIFYANRKSLVDSRLLLIEYDFEKHSRSSVNHSQQTKRSNVSE